MSFSFIGFSNQPRWYGNAYPGGRLIIDDFYRGGNEFYVKNYHGELVLPPFAVEHRRITLLYTNKSIEYSIAFWDRVYTSRTNMVSDPVTRTRGSPVGVDFFTIRERSDQFGPFGERHPLQKFNLTGRGHFRCAGKTTSF